jgi:hypothetical protein
MTLEVEAEDLPGEPMDIDDHDEDDEDDENEGDDDESLESAALPVAKKDDNSNDGWDWE